MHVSYICLVYVDRGLQKYPWFCFLFFSLSLFFYHVKPFLFFPEQFSPYQFFGCELKSHFNGTLFRFPLRTAAAARDSEISHTSYSPDSVMNLLNQFKDQANR